MKPIMKSVRILGYGWALPHAKSKRWHWFEGGYAICNLVMRNFQLRIQGYILVEGVYVLYCSKCYGKFKHDDLLEESFQIGRLRSVMGIEEVIRK